MFPVTPVKKINTTLNISLVLFTSLICLILIIYILSFNLNEQVGVCLAGQVVRESRFRKGEIHLSRTGFFFEC